MFNIDVTPLTGFGFWTLLLILLLTPALAVAAAASVAAILWYRVATEVGYRIRKATYRVIGSVRKLR